jgi:hypothetical protein
MPSKFPVQTMATIRFLRQLADDQPDQLYAATEAFFVRSAALTSACVV